MADLIPYALRQIDREEDGDEHFFRPFTLVDSHNDVWDIATNRKWLVAFKGHGQYPRWGGDADTFLTLLRLIQTEPIEPRWVALDKLVEWSKGAGKDDLGRLLGAVVSLDKVALLLGLVTDRIQVWNSRPATEGEPSVGFDRPGMRVILMGHDEPKIDKGTTIKPFEHEGEPVTGIEDAQDGFALAMSLDE